MEVSLVYFLFFESVLACLCLGLFLSLSGTDSSLIHILPYRTIF